MTGAPKIRAMDIEELEDSRRGMYAGIFGVIGFGGFADLALCIRTVIRDGNALHTRVRRRRGRLLADRRVGRDAGQAPLVGVGGHGEGTPVKALLVDAFDGFSDVIYQYLSVIGLDGEVVRSGVLTPGRCSGTVRKWSSWPGPGQPAGLRPRHDRPCPDRPQAGPGRVPGAPEHRGGVRRRCPRRGMSCTARPAPSSTAAPACSRPATAR
jgi:hypothetical protein